MLLHEEIFAILTSIWGQLLFFHTHVVMASDWSRSSEYEYEIMSCVSILLVVRCPLVAVLTVSGCHGLVTRYRCKYKLLLLILLNPLKLCLYLPCKSSQLSASLAFWFKYFKLNILCVLGFCRKYCKYCYSLQQIWQIYPRVIFKNWYFPIWDCKM